MTKTRSEGANAVSECKSCSLFSYIVAIVAVATFADESVQFGAYCRMRRAI